MTKPFGPDPGRPLRFTFVSSNYGWGGSEDLWSGAALRLAAAGHRIDVFKNRLEPGSGHVAELRAAGCRLTELARFPVLPKKFYAPIAMYAWQLGVTWQALRLRACLQLRRRPDLVILSQGLNHDAWLLAGVCRRLKLPYVVVSQKASELYWPEDWYWAQFRALHAGALHSFFVSAHNRRLTEEQLGMGIPHASVVRNPFKVPWKECAPWPGDEGGLRLACVGRLWTKDKGQDILLRVMASDKWRRRKLSLSIFGGGDNERGLIAMAGHLGLGNVGFRGHEDDIAALWAEHHGLLLASRAEGLPLVLVEAMLSGRVPIVTHVAGNSELVREGETGFLAASATETAIDSAMEQAWRRREEWPEIGRRAAAAARALVPPDPAQVFADRLVRLAAGMPLAADADPQEALTDAA